jgi:3,4-dehydroadipyl-CoA semialdehyde dehydrogenase
MYELTSYLAGAWHRGSGSERKIYNPATEEELGSVDGGGLDFAAAYAHALEKGVPALAELSFAERGNLLKALSKKLYEHRDELIELAILNGGNTRGDAKFDIDGATGTLAYYGSLGKSLGDRRFVSDGEGEALGRSPRFFGQHLWTTRPGLAVHVNAFNFPAWGMGEKMACALLAGVPVLEKAGTPSALLAWRMAQITVESGILPEGAFQFVSGPLGDLFERLGAMDAVAFTGSAVTGHKIRGNAALLQNNVRVNVEADSINSAVMGPDVEEDSETWDLFVSMVAGEITQKAGQKCTAIRRILVPQERVRDVCEALSERLGKTQVGNPADENVRMGPVASKSQDDDVRAGMKTLLAHCDAVCGGPDALFDKGYFFAPTLLEAKDADADALHSLEVFGPLLDRDPLFGGREGRDPPRQPRRRQPGLEPLLRRQGLEQRRRPRHRPLARPRLDRQREGRRQGHASGRRPPAVRSRRPRPRRRWRGARRAAWPAVLHAAHGPAGRPGPGRSPLRPGQGRGLSR